MKAKSCPGVPGGSYPLSWPPVTETQRKTISAVLQDPTRDAEGFESHRES